MLNNRFTSVFIFVFVILVFSSCEDIQNHNVRPSVSSENDMFKLTIIADTDVATLTNTIPFQVIVRRKDSYAIRHDSRLIGTWALHSMSINNQNQNISQFPTTIEFYEDSAYSRMITNTVSNVESYYGGYWSLDLNNQLTLIEQGNETLIQVSDIEILFSDSIDVASQIREGRNKVKLSIYKNLPHVWQIFGFLPEAKVAIKEISEFLSV